VIFIYNKFTINPINRAKDWDLLLDPTSLLEPGSKASHFINDISALVESSVKDVCQKPGPLANTGRWNPAACTGPVFTFQIDGGACEQVRGRSILFPLFFRSFAFFLFLLTFFTAAHLTPYVFILTSPVTYDTNKVEDVLICSKPSVFVAEAPASCNRKFFTPPTICGKRCQVSSCSYRDTSLNHNSAYENKRRCIQYEINTHVSMLLVTLSSSHNPLIMYPLTRRSARSWAR
jgi:hypothetical protein